MLQHYTRAQDLTFLKKCRPNFVVNRFKLDKIFQVLKRLLSRFPYGQLGFK